MFNNLSFIQPLIHLFWLIWQEPKDSRCVRNNKSYGFDRAKLPAVLWLLCDELQAAASVRRRSQRTGKNLMMCWTRISFNKSIEQKMKLWSKTKNKNNSLQKLMKQGKISYKTYQRLSSNGSQPAGDYGLAKVHRKVTPLQPVLSIPASSYENLNRFPAPFFQKPPGANIETNTQDARTALESLSFEDNEQRVSLDVKSLYTNVPVRGAKVFALRELYPSNPAPEIPRSAMKS